MATRCSLDILPHNYWWPLLTVVWPLLAVLGLCSRLFVALAQELSALLAFLSSLNAVLWYDTPTLRDLVILDPQARDVGA